MSTINPTTKPSSTTSFSDQSLFTNSGSTTTFLPISTAWSFSNAGCEDIFLISSSEVGVFYPGFASGDCLPPQVTVSVSSGDGKGGDVLLGPTFNCPSVYTTASANKNGGKEEVICCPSNFILLIPSTQTSTVNAFTQGQCISTMPSGSTLTYHYAITTSSTKTYFPTSLRLQNPVPIHALPILGYNIPSSTSTLSHPATIGLSVSLTFFILSFLIFLFLLLRRRSNKKKSACPLWLREHSKSPTSPLQSPTRGFFGRRRRSKTMSISLPPPPAPKEGIMVFKEIEEPSFSPTRSISRSPTINSNMKLQEALNWAQTPLQKVPFELSAVNKRRSENEEARIRRTTISYVGVPNGSADGENERKEKKEMVMKSPVISPFTPFVGERRFMGLVGKKEEEVVSPMTAMPEGWDKMKLKGLGGDKLSGKPIG